MTTDLHTWLRHHLPDLPDDFALEPVQSGSSSTVSRLDTPNGRYFHKTCEIAFGFEPPLVATLADWFPAVLPDVVAWDAENRWLLLGDAGDTLRNISRADGVRWPQWERVLRKMAALQIAAIEHVDDLLALGIMDRRLSQLPALYQTLIADTPALLIGPNADITPAAAARLPQFAAEVERLCDAVGRYHVPQTLHHDDFHAGNIGLRGDEVRILDWGEACVAHPFFSLTMMLRYAKLVFEATDGVLDRLTAAYLEAWTIFEPMPRLLELLPLTHQLTALCRTGTWAYALRHADSTFRAENGDAVPYWLMTLVNNTPLQ